mgnify:CR=1 FL=1
MIRAMTVVIKGWRNSEGRIIPGQITAANSLIHVFAGEGGSGNGDCDGMETATMEQAQTRSRETLRINQAVNEADDGQ